MTIDPQWTAMVERSLHEFLEWVGFGTVVGLTAKAIMPGKDPGGAVATLLMGIIGTVIGCGTLGFFMPQAKVTPISLGGFIAGTSGAFLLLAMYRVLSVGQRKQIDVWVSPMAQGRQRQSEIRETVRRSA